MAKDHGPTIKNDAVYEALRRDSYGKATAASIANAQANDEMSPSKKGGKQPPYEEWTHEALYERARDLDVFGRSEMTKDDLISALRDQ